MLNKKTFLAFFCCSISLFLFFGSFTIDDPIEKFVISLQKWTETNPQEKVYLHMDKPYYAIGDTIWFKAYITIGSRHQLSALSGALYVDLINEKDSIQQTLKLPVTAGMAIGDFTLGDDFKYGNYRIRAYTQWMRNSGEDYFFDRAFMVGDISMKEPIVKIEYKYTVMNSKPSIVAQLNYSDSEGNSISDKEVSYSIIANGNIVLSEKTKTDVYGNLAVALLNNKKMDLKDFREIYIKTVVELKNQVRMTKILPVKIAQFNNDVQFFPESGNLINGISSKVAFKALGIDGAGISIKGIIIDNDNQEVTKFESEYAGMGVFNLKPEIGKSYKAKIAFTDRSEMTIALPKAEDQGYVLAIYQPTKDSLLVRINASMDQIQKKSVLGLIAQCSGDIIYGSQVKIVKSSTSIWLPKKDFPTGIAQFTLFSDEGIPLKERVAFVKNDDQMQLNLSTSKTSYKGKEKVEVGVYAKDKTGKPVAGNFSVAVINETKVPFDGNSESTILSTTLLSSDLKGYIETPNYYLVNNTDEVNRDLDNLMLTQGYRRFVWKEILNPIQIRPTFKPEKLASEISGKVVSLSNKPVVNGKVTLISLKAGIVKEVNTDVNGNFKFEGLILTDSIKFAIQARTNKNGKQLEVILDSVPKQQLNKNKNIPDINTDISNSMKVYLDNSRKQDEIQGKLGGLNRGQRLKEVMITARRKQNEKYTAQGSFQVPDGHADQTYIMEDGEKCATLGICLQGMIHGVVFTNYQKAQCFIPNFPHIRDGNILMPMSVFLDGRKVTSCDELKDIFELNVLDPASIGKIDVVRLSMTFSSGLYIITKRGWENRPRYIPSILNVSLKGFNKARQFYSPLYDESNSIHPMADIRSTIYWNASIKTNSDGKTKFDFFNAAEPGEYKIIIEGINASGELGRQVYRYTVN